MRQTFDIPGRFCSLNEFYRMHHLQQGALKKQNDDLVAWSAKAAKVKPVSRPVLLRCHWVEQNHRRDLDNVFFGVKFVQDGLVKSGVLANDTHHEIQGISHTIGYDSRNPHIEVTIEEA